MISLERFTRCLAVAAIVAVVAQGCDKSPRIDDNSHPLLTDYSKRHPIVVVADSPTLELPLRGEHGAGEPPVHLDAMRFLLKYRQEGKGPLTVWLPSHPAEQRAVASRMRMLRNVAQQSGVPTSAIRVRERPTYMGQQHAMTLSYERIAAVGPACGDWSENIANNPDKLPYANYGCASQRNLAAMVARPTDFIFPAPEVARGGDRRAADYRTFTKSGASSGAPSSSATSAGMAPASMAPGAN